MVVSFHLHIKRAVIGFNAVCLSIDKLQCCIFNGFNHILERPVAVSLESRILTHNRPGIDPIIFCLRIAGRWYLMGPSRAAPCTLGIIIHCETVAIVLMDCLCMI